MYPTILRSRTREDPIRLWVPGCSSGEEVYSLAIALLEFLGDKAGATPIQIFGTDVSTTALEKARGGIYIENIALDVSPERLRRWFVRVDRGYQISKDIREMCIFAKQNLTSDPPFSKIDLISCRNLLIYLDAVLQARVMPIFHYALKANGFLMLGNSESVGSYADLFAPVDKRAKIYTKKFSTMLPASFARPLEKHLEKNQFPMVERLPSPPPTSNGRLTFSSFHVLRRLESLSTTSSKSSNFAAQRATTLNPPQAGPRFICSRWRGAILVLNFGRSFSRRNRRNAPSARKSSTFSPKQGAARNIAIEVAPIRVDASANYSFS